jgi:hypothetical protein
MKDRLARFLWLAQNDPYTAGIWLVSAIGLLLGLVFLFLAPWKRAFGFARSHDLPNIRTEYALPGVLKYFDDTEIGVRCYWFGSEHSLTCVKAH